MPKLGFRKRAGRIVRRVVNRGVKYAKRRYINKKGNLRLGKVVRDIAQVKRMLNTEKKQAVGVYSGFVAQVDGNADGAVIFDITPSIAQGDDFNQRNGRKLKITSAYIQGQFYQQNGNHNSGHIVIELWRHKTQEKTMSLASTGQELFDANPITTMLDSYCSRNQSYFKEYIKVATRKVYIKQDNYSSVGNTERQFKIPLKLNYHMTWNTRDNTFMDGQIFVTMRCSTGNKSGTTTSTNTNISQTAIDTGYRYNLHTKFYYVDN